MDSFNQRPGFIPKALKIGMGLDRSSVDSRCPLNPNVAPFAHEQFENQYNGLNGLRPTFPPAPR